MSEKLPGIEKLLFSVMKKERVECIHENKCIACNNSITGFKDETSKKEFTISALCQHCQDEVFGGQ